VSNIEKLAKLQSDTEDKEKEKVTQAQVLIALAADIELFHAPDGDCYATINTGTHCETWPLKSKAFRRWLLRRFYEMQDKPPGAQAMQDALAVLEAKAHFNGPELPIHIRVAELNGNIYIDLCNETWAGVEVSPEGWRIVTDPPVKFRRTKAMMSLPEPETGGSIAELRKFVNLPDDNGWRLLVACLVAALRPRGPYPLPVLQGEQGSAKSTTAKVFRALADPSTAPLRTTPRDERDLAIATRNAWILAFDNLSGVPVWLSDALCRISTGGGFATRELYSNEEEVIFDFMRPVILNGIDEIATRHDLLDRCVILNLPAIPEKCRQDENKFWDSFNEAQPRIFGALLDAVAVALRNVNTVKLDRLPRMADFAKWVVAAEEVLPWEPGGFMVAYSSNRMDAVELALEADVVAVAVKSLLVQSYTWKGTATELLTELEKHVKEQTRKSKTWPKTARTLGNRLRRCATFLRQTGIDMEFEREGRDRKRVIRISMQSSALNGQNVLNTDKTLVLPGLKTRTQNDESDENDRITSVFKPPKYEDEDIADNNDAKKHNLSKVSSDDEAESLKELTI
jgi:hypothetical protein